jgi:hypothetical protein
MEFLIQQTELCARLGISLTDIATNKLFTLVELKRWLNLGKDWALNYKRWPFLEHQDTDVIDATGTYPYQAEMKTKSIYLITVAGERFKKIRYEDYLKYLEDYSSGNDKVWAEHDRDTFINGNACSVGDAVIMFGYEAAADMVGDTTVTPFDAAEPAGDEAVVLRALAIGLRIKKKEIEARGAEKEAENILDKIWARIAEAKPREVLKSTPLLKRINVLKGTISEVSQDLTGRF